MFCIKYDRKWEIGKNIIGVIDDEQIFINMASTEIQDTNIAMKYSQKASKYWEHLLYTIGGKLQYSKCVFYVTEWKFKNDGIATIN